MVLSIIIPTYNEAKVIQKTIAYLQQHVAHKEHEIIISDAGSTDGTVTIAQRCGAKVLHSPLKGRAGQMNYGAQDASGTAFFFCARGLFANTCFF